MQQFDATNLVVHPGNSADPEVIVEVNPEQTGLDFVHFQVRKLEASRSWSFETGENELALVLLSGKIGVASDKGQWSDLTRKDVFSGPPTAVYLPRHSTLTVSAAAASEFALAWTATDQDHAARFISPDEIAVEIRGGDNVTRQINSIIPPGFPCQHLVLVEVYTPGGGWSSYPPHKHDVHKTDENGMVREADLEEIYYYKLDKPEGYAFQRIYTDPESPLHRAGYPIDSVVMARDNDAVLIPEGYHPVTSAPGYTTYYLNTLAGSAQSLAASDDPQYAWVKQTYTTRDARIPLYEVKKPAKV